MKIRTKILSFGGFNIAIQLITLVIIITIFSSLLTGFSEIIEKANTNQQLSQKSQDDISSTSQQVEKMVNQMADLNNLIGSTNSTIKVLEKKIVSSSESLSEMLEVIESVLDSIDDEAVQDHLYDMADGISDLQETMKREALISLQSSVASMNESTRKVGEQLENINIISTNLDRLKENGINAAKESSEILSISTLFAESIEKNKIFLSVLILVFAASTVLISIFISRTITVPLMKVVDMVKDIAQGEGDLTKRDAGKGFAVVAGEIKELASQAANATKDIKERILKIQSYTEDTVLDVTKISEVITEVNGIVLTIAESVDEQSAGATEIAQNISQATSGIMEVNENVSQSSLVSSEIAQDISGVNAVAEDMSKTSTQLNQSATDLSGLSLNLRDLISVFKVSSDVDSQSSTSTLSEGQIPDLMPWGPKYMLGIGEIDDQHVKLVGLINKQHRFMKLQKSTENADGVLKELTDYTEYHFKYEESLLEKYGYPEKRAHLKSHEKLVDQVAKFKMQRKEGGASLNMDIMIFLTDWLKVHILESDKAYVPFLREKM